MEWLITIVLVLFIVYLLYDETLGEAPVLTPRKRLCDYYVAGSVYQDIPAALARGVRLLEVHVYSDEQDQPVVALKPQNDGYDYAQHLRVMGGGKFIGADGRKWDMPVQQEVELPPEVLPYG